MYSNLPVYTSSSIDMVAISAIDSLMHKNFSDIFEEIDLDPSKSLEDKKASLSSVLHLMENISSMPSLDFISRVHTMYNKGIINNYETIDNILIPYRRAFSDVPDIKMSPFSELMKGKLIPPVQDEKIFKEYLIQLQQLMKSRLSITMHQLYEENHVLKKYNLGYKQVILSTENKRGARSKSLGK